MTGDRIAVIGLCCTLVLTIFGGGMFMGRQASEIAALTKTVEQLRTERFKDIDQKIDGLRADLNGSRIEVLQWMNAHDERGRR